MPVTRNTTASKHATPIKPDKRTLAKKTPSSKRVSDDDISVGADASDADADVDSDQSEPLAKELKPISSTRSKKRGRVESSESEKESEKEDDPVKIVPSTPKKPRPLPTPRKPSASANKKRGRVESSESEKEKDDTPKIVPSTPRKLRPTATPRKLSASANKKFKVEVIVPSLKGSVNEEDSVDDVKMPSPSPKKKIVPFQAKGTSASPGKVSSARPLFVPSNAPPRSKPKADVKSSKTVESTVSEADLMGESDGGDGEDGDEESKDDGEEESKEEGDDDLRSPIQLKGKSKGKAKAAESEEDLFEGGEEGEDIDDGLGDLSENDKAQIKSIVNENKSSIRQDLVEKKAKSKRTLDSFVIKKGPVTTETGIRVYFNELPKGVKFTSDPSPEECEVADKHFIDPLLRKSYEDLPKLSFRVLMSWNDTPGWGNPMFSLMVDKELYDL